MEEIAEFDLAPQYERSLTRTFQSFSIETEKLIFQVVNVTPNK